MFGRAVTLVFLGFATLSVMSVMGSAFFAADSLSGFRSLTIRTQGGFAVDPGESLLLTAEGDYVTYTIPVLAVWSIRSGNELGSFTGACNAHEQCTFRAGNTGGNVQVRADGNGRSDEVTIRINAPVAPVPVESPFKDDLPLWAGKPIVELNTRQIIRGYDDGRFGAGDSLTRGQLIVLIHRALSSLRLLQGSGDCRMPYQDVPQNHYAYTAACDFRSMGWTDALSTLEPDKKVSRMEAAGLLSRVLGVPLMEAKGLSLKRIMSKGVIFRDISETHSAYVDTAIMEAFGIMKGNPDGTFNPTGILNRAEAATIVWRAMEVVQGEGVRGL